MKTRSILLWLALLMMVCVGSATLIDLGDYILSTGSQTVNPNFAFGSRNETTGDYTALVSFGEGNKLTSLALIESNNLTDLDEKNSTANGFKPVKKPYPGYLKINSTDDSVAYKGKVTNNLTIIVTIASYQEAINLLKNLEVMSRKQYQSLKSGELAASLGG